tara:strand:- start:205 stop:543 length:339 start_codon:yes stop_codon:yes gene_type:complete
MKKKLINLTKDYFSFFRDKDIINLAKIMDKNINLLDWENSIKGKKKILNFNKKIFKNFKKIEIKVKNIAILEEKRISCNQIIIKLDNHSINVIDVLYFNKKNMITKIEAYKR